MEINISVLYPALFNHYGDAGNIAALKYRLEQRGIQVNVQNISSPCELRTENTDILYIGGATDSNLAAVYESIYQTKDKIKSYVESGGVLLGVCTGYEMLGKSFETESAKYDGLGVLDITSHAGKKRIIGNIVTKCESLGFDIVGFENHIGTVEIGNNTPLGKVIFGHGNTEGVIYKNVVGTYIHGPLLPKNPQLADYIIKNALQRKYGNCTLEALDDELEKSAHEYIKKTYIKK